MMNTRNNDRGETAYKKELQALDFALQEVVLYLDAYPESEQALSYYHKLRHERERMIAEYQRRYGPLTMYGNESTGSWDWIMTPWPWEFDAN